MSLLPTNDKEGDMSYVFINNPYPTGNESLCHQYRARPACTFVQSDQALYYWLTNFHVLILISLKMIMVSPKNNEGGLFHLPA